MEKTPILSRSRPSFRRNNNFSTGNNDYKCVLGTSTENEPKENSNTTCSTTFLDAKLCTDIDNDDSPVHIACTQEGCENVDVVWDWNSPQTKHKPKRSQKRLILQSPKIPLKRHPSNNHIQNFEKLRGELQLLREEISVPDNEECLVLSPLEEAEYKDINNGQNKSAITSLMQGNYPAHHDDDDLFNDSVDEQLMLFSQKIETDLNTMGQIKNQLTSNNNGNNLEVKGTTVQNSKKLVNKLTSVKDNNLGFHSVKSEDARSINDSFNCILQEFKVDSIEEVTEVADRVNINQSKTNHQSFSRTRSENQYKTLKPTNTGKVEFHRTQSFEFTFEHNQAKLELKRRHEYSDSPMKCTPVEIEQKRLQALAKLEAKRQQDAIERKRQEALKRLELNRKKNATIVKSSLTKRL
ncbi:hypothetical protein NQ314_013325 [Rhamnusium bicolor]|uniref:Uncharacterized protein n=1 Tax=Rhamnusium bicolor TaxID=1586634 RepID=A0AAV8X6B2_9CUCU|nr:hypothetical protein NQ314_013325 [Rhamnusium bicolor]